MKADDKQQFGLFDSEKVLQQDKMTGAADG
jgi:hypothetical protein